MLVGNVIVHMAQDKSQKLSKKETFVSLKNQGNPSEQMIGS